jgi:hypothetical protein
MSVEVAGEVQLKEGHLHRATRSTGQADDLVDRYGRRASSSSTSPSAPASPSTHRGTAGS